MLREWLMQKDIALSLWRSKSTVSEEIKRWTRNWEYQPLYAQHKYEVSKSEANKWRSKIKSDPELQAHIRKRIIEDWWPPDSIAWRDKLGVCTQTIYNYIREWEPDLVKHLPYKKWYKKRWYSDGRWKKKEWYRLITERCEAANNRSEVWHMEIDTIHSSWSCRTWWLVTIVDRMTKHTRCDRILDRKAETVTKSLISLLTWLPKEKLLTLTADNGKEFNGFMEVEETLTVLFYFAHTYASYERGTNEQTNGMIRKFFPKWTDFSKVSVDDIKLAIHKINHRPRKSLKYLSSHEAFYWVTLDL